jgi:uncharacterized protein YqeY
MPSLTEQLKEQQKDAMRAKDKLRLGTIRMALAGIKQKEIDEKITLNDEQVIVQLTKMIKQRKDAAEQFQQANRQDLADTEKAEIAVLQDFLPQPLTEEQLDTLVKQALNETGATSMQAMGQVMGWLKPKVQGRTDMGKLSSLIKAKLSA